MVGVFLALRPAPFVGRMVKDAAKIFLKLHFMPLLFKEWVLNIQLY